MIGIFPVRGVIAYTYRKEVCCKLWTTSTDVFNLYRRFSLRVRGFALTFIF